MKADELWGTTALIYVDKGQYYTVSRRTPNKEVRPSIMKLCTQVMTKMKNELICQIFHKKNQKVLMTIDKMADVFLNSNNF